MDFAESRAGPGNYLPAQIVHRSSAIESCCAGQSLLEVVVADHEDETKLDSRGSPRRDALIATEDTSFADLLLYHDIKVRDSILLCMVSDHGPMKIARLSRLAGIEPRTLLKCVMRLAADDLLSSETPEPGIPGMDTVVQLTRRGKRVANRIGDQLE
jgi:hypothetical protein